MFLTELDTRYIGGGNSQLLSDFVYEDAKKGLISAPLGFETDFASIPRVLRILVTGTRNTKRAAVIHDFLYRRQPNGFTRRDADKIFLRAMREKDPAEPEFNVPIWKAYTVYWGVKAGGWVTWNKHTRTLING